MHSIQSFDELILSTLYSAHSIQNHELETLVFIGLYWFLLVFIGLCRLGFVGFNSSLVGVLGFVTSTQPTTVDSLTIQFHEAIDRV